VSPTRPLRRVRIARAAVVILALAFAAPHLLHPTPARGLVRPARETGRAALWRKLYDAFPQPWKSRDVVVVREVSDREMDRLVREHGDDNSRDSADDDEVQGYFEFTGPREETPLIVLRDSLTEPEATFVFSHEYGHYVWEELLTKRDQDEYFRIWNSRRRDKRLVSTYAGDSVVEGFAEAFAHYLRRSAQLHRKDPDSEQFLRDWLDDHRPADDKR